MPLSLRCYLIRCVARPPRWRQASGGCRHITPLPHYCHIILHDITRLILHIRHAYFRQHELTRCHIYFSGGDDIAIIIIGADITHIATIRHAADALTLPLIYLLRHVTISYAILLLLRAFTIGSWYRYAYA